MVFPNRQTLSSELSWSQYYLLMRVENENARKFYIEEAIKANWSVRQLKRQIDTFSYERLLVSHGHYAVVQDTTDREPV